MWYSLLNSVSSNTSADLTPDLQLQERKSASKSSNPSSWSWVLMHLPKVLISLNPCGNIMRNTNTKLLNQIQHKFVYVVSVFYRQLKLIPNQNVHICFCPLFPNTVTLWWGREKSFSLQHVTQYDFKYFIFLSLPQMCLGHLLPNHRTFLFATPFH